MSLTRRNFLKYSLVAGAAINFFSKADAGNPVSEGDPEAKSLGYVANASNVDKAKFQMYAAGQACNNCSVYQGKVGASSGPCPIFSGKDVSAAGWCSAYSSY